jgi:hypothetical protein
MDMTMEEVSSPGPAASDGKTIIEAPTVLDVIRSAADRMEVNVLMSNEDLKVGDDNCDDTDDTEEDGVAVSAVLATVAALVLLLLVLLVMALLRLVDDDDEEEDEEEEDSSLLGFPFILMPFMYCGGKFLVLPVALL